MELFCNKKESCEQGNVETARETLAVEGTYFGINAEIATVPGVRMLRVHAQGFFCRLEVEPLFDIGKIVALVGTATHASVSGRSGQQTSMPTVQALTSGGFAHLI